MEKKREREMADKLINTQRDRQRTAQRFLVTFDLNGRSLNMNNKSILKLRATTKVSKQNNKVGMNTDLEKINESTTIDIISRHLKTH